jgi:hypothetical protein
MRFFAAVNSLAAPALILTASICPAQVYTTSAPDGTPGITSVPGCATSQFFQFAYRLPEGMALQDMSHAPNGGEDPTHRNYVLFMASRARGVNQDVVDVAAEDRRSASDSSAASWMRALHNWNAKRSDVPMQGEVETVSVSGQDLSRLEFQQSRQDGVITYEAAYAFGVKGFVVYFIFGSISRSALDDLAKSIRSLSIGSGNCNPVN